MSHLFSAWICHTGFINILLSQLYHMLGLSHMICSLLLYMRFSHTLILLRSNCCTCIKLTLPLARFCGCLCHRRLCPHYPLQFSIHGDHYGFRFTLQIHCLSCSPVLNCAPKCLVTNSSDLSRASAFVMKYAVLLVPSTLVKLTTL